MGLVDLCCSLLKLGRVLVLQMNGVKVKYTAGEEKMQATTKYYCLFWKSVN